MAKSLTEAVITRSADLLVIGGEDREWHTLHEGTLQELLVDVPCPIMTFLPGRLGVLTRNNAYATLISAP